MTTIDINPEFGIELALGLPYAYWLHENNQLEKVVVSRGMKPFYYFCDNVEEKYNFRTIDNSEAGLDSLPNPWIYGNRSNAQIYKDEWPLWEEFMWNFNSWQMSKHSPMSVKCTFRWSCCARCIAYKRWVFSSGT